MSQQTNKVKAIELDGGEVVVNLGVNYFFKYFHEDTGVDLIRENMFEVETVKVLEYLSAFLHAGHKAHLSLKREECKMSLDDFQHIVYSMDFTEAMRLLTECATIMKGDSKEDDEKNVPAQASEAA